MNTKPSKPSKTRDYAQLILAIVLLIIGIILIAQPTGSMVVIVSIIGIGLLVYGAAIIIMYLSKKRKGEETPNLALPIIAIVIGVLILIFRDGVANFLLPIIIGAWALIAGIISLVHALQVKKLGATSWTVLLITAIVELVIGIIIVVAMITGGNAIGSILGVLLLIFGIMSIIDWAATSSAKKNSITF